MSSDASDERLDLSPLSAASRPGLEARVAEAVRTRISGERKGPLAQFFDELDRIRWRAVATAAALVAVSAAAARFAPGGAPLEGGLQDDPMADLVIRLQEATVPTPAPGGTP